MCKFQFEAFQQYENIQNSDEALSDSVVTGASGVHVPDGLLHQVRHPNYPNVENLPGYMQVCTSLLHFCLAPVVSYRGNW